MDQPPIENNGKVCIKILQIDFLNTMDRDKKQAGIGDESTLKRLELHYDDFFSLQFLLRDAHQLTR